MKKSYPKIFVPHTLKLAQYPILNMWQQTLYQGPFYDEKIPHTIGNQIFSLKCGFGVSQKYQPIQVSASISDLNQNSGFGRTLPQNNSFCQSRKTLKNQILSGLKCNFLILLKLYFFKEIRLQYETCYLKETLVVPSFMNSVLFEMGLKKLLILTPFLLPQPLKLRRL